MIVNFINILGLKKLILQLSMKCLPVKNDCQLYKYIRSKKVDIATKYEVFIYLKWSWILLIC